MRIAVPVVNGQLARHFGHCQQFMVFEVDADEGRITGAQPLEAPSHQPGLLPAWLKERGVDVVIAGGMGRRAQGLFAAGGVEVVVGAVSEDPRKIVEEYLSGALTTGENPCDH